MSTKANPAHRWQRLEVLFERALEIDVEQRQTWLGAQELEEEVRQELAAMLLAHQRDVSWFQLPSLGEAGDLQPRTDPLEGQQLGAYRILECVGEGGMGRVYRARRIDGVADVEVAIKVLRPLGTAVSALQRFQLERAVLARLDHPNIASMIDGGVTGDGLPYLVMQYVDGEPLLAWCDQRRCSIRQRVELMVEVCRAVEYAHNHLVVHRDIKSSNMLVSADGTVKLLDFGIAKLLDPETLDSGSLAFELHQTRTETRVATPLNAAPEQLLGGDITTATDVYGLGVLLFELLCGRLPYEIETGRRAEVEQAVVERPPLRPQLALRTTSSLHPTSIAEISARRAVSESDLARQLRGDLESIVLMALRKEPERRYQSAGRLGEDLARYLEGLPVRARPDTPGYRLRKFVGRNRIVVGASALLMLVLLVVAISTTLQARRLARERDRSELLAQTMVSVLESGMPGTALSDSISVSDLMATVESSIADLEDRPLDQAQLLRVLGRIHQARGRPLDAVTTFEQELDAWRRADRLDEPEVAELRWQLAQASDEAGVRDRAPQLYREAIVALEKIDEDDRRLIRARKNLTRYLPAFEAWQGLQLLMRETLEKRRPGERESDNNLARLHFEMGSLLGKLGRRREAAEQFERGLELINRHHHPLSRAPLTLRGELAFVRDEDPGAEIGELREVVELRGETAGFDTALVGESRLMLGRKLAEHGYWKEAAEELARAEELLQMTLSPKSEQFAEIAMARATLARAARDWEREVAELQRAAELLNDPVDRAAVRARLAVAWARQDSERSKRHATASIEELQVGWDPRIGSDWRVARAWGDLVHAALARGDEEAAIAAQRGLSLAEAWDEPPSWFPPTAALAKRWIEISSASGEGLAAAGEDIATRRLIEEFRRAAGIDPRFAELGGG